MNPRDASTEGRDNSLLTRDDGGVTSRETLRVDGRLLGSLSDLLLMLGGCLIFFVVGGWLIDAGNPLGWVVIVPSAIGALLTLLMALISVPLLTVDERGLRIRPSLRPSRLVPWSEVGDIQADPDGRRIVLYEHLGAEVPEPKIADPWFTPFTPGRIDLRGSHAKLPELLRDLEAARPETPA